MRLREAAHQGAMIALLVAGPAADELAVDGGEQPEDLHITLAYLGSPASEFDFTEDDVAAVVADVAAATPPLAGSTQGVGRFTAVEDGTLDALWASPDVVGLDALRTRLVDALAAAGIPLPATHGFTPHITLAYVPTGDDGPEISTTPVDLAFTEIHLVWAGNLTSFPLEGDTMKSKTSEAFPGDRTYNDVRALIESALTERFGGERTWIWVRDLTDTDAIYTVEADTEMCTYKVTFTVADDGAITLGDPVEVEARTTYEPLPGATPSTNVTEARQHLEGRVIEAKGTTPDGGRIFAVQVLQYGVSRNGVRYTESVMREAADLYAGAKVYDHHRTSAELASSTLAGLVGVIRNPEATATALEAELHLLPSATHVAEALDAALAQGDGMPTFVGLSHDVAISQTEAIEGGRKIKEATAIHSVFSVDVVADPSAGGRVTRQVAGGFCDTELPEEINMKTLADLLAEASDEDKAAFQGLLAGGSGGSTTTPPDPGAGGDGVAVTEATVHYNASSPVGRFIVETAMRQAELDARLTESITAELGDRWTEADLATAIDKAKRFGEAFEVSGLRPGVPHNVAVTKEAFTKKLERLDRTLEGGPDGYTSIKQAFVDIAGSNGLDAFDAELAFTILTESRNHNRYEGRRQTESVDSTTWGQAFADAMHKRLVSVYSGNNFQAWRDLVSSIVPRTDFRPNRAVKVGGYGVLPTVAEGDPYTALTSPPDEEATYTLAKKGGTEDLTLEAIANDDLGVVRRIPEALARAAALTLYRFVVDSLMKNNPTIYDSVALFASGHANTNTLALTDANLSAVRAKMRKQAAYGVAADVLGITPKYLWVPADLEDMAWKLCTSAVAVTSDGNATVPNMHSRMEPRVIDHWTDPTDWFVTADTATVETIELGFFNGKQDPELFVQDDPKVGANFTNDKVTWKIRHIYAGAVVDYRGFQRSVVADS